MRRYIILYNNGTIVQQQGLNITHTHLHSIGLIKMIINTVNGEIIKGGDEWKWTKIDEYHDATLIIPEK